VLTAAHCTCTDKLKCNNGKAEYNAKEEFVGELFKYCFFFWEKKMLAREHGPNN
jgi:hypothetical protein